jgi:hypothetical protein
MSALDWVDANQRHLTAAVAEVRRLLDLKSGAEPNAAPPAPPPAAERPFALDVVCGVFGLSPFERHLLLLCAAIELDSAFGPLCAALHGDPSRTYPTFALALGVLPGAHWSALAPAAPLRRRRLIEAGGGSLTSAPLRIDERVLHFLAGIDELDERLAGVVEPLAPPCELAESHGAAAARIASLWHAALHGGEPFLPIQLCAPDAATARAIAAAACAQAGFRGYAVSAFALPAAAAELDGVVRLWERDAALSAAALLLDCEALDAGDPLRQESVRQFAARLSVPLLVAAREPRFTLPRCAATIDVPRARPAEQRMLWMAALGAAAARVDGALDRISAQFSVPAAAIPALASAARDADDPGAVLWDACRAGARRRVEELAQRIDARAGWDDLVLPDAQLAVLRDLVDCVRFRTRVYDEWGFAAKDSRGLGVSVLFSGASGTGKTLAAEVIAGALRLDLYRIDLSGVVSKYIGETEKNLRRVFDAAEEGGAILLFDEADALFGKRSEVKDSHDRYANIEVSYLLQRMEAYRGVAILTTNSRDALDTAFLRRLRFAVDFPFPAEGERREIWRRMFPRELQSEGIDVGKLARLALAGGNIRNIAVNAAFGAARDASPLTMRHLLDASRAEYSKLEKTLASSEVEGWV